MSRPRCGRQALRSAPGLVGGHCIGVDPYYLTFKAEAIGYHPDMIVAGRRINDGMGKYVAEKTVKMLIRGQRQVSGATPIQWPPTRPG